MPYTTSISLLQGTDQSNRCPLVYITAKQRKKDTTSSGLCYLCVTYMVTAMYNNNTIMDGGEMIYCIHATSTGPILPIVVYQWCGRVHVGVG